MYSWKIISINCKRRGRNRTWGTWRCVELLPAISGKCLIIMILLNSSSYIIVSCTLCFYSFAPLRTSLPEGDKLFCIFRLYFFRFILFCFVLVIPLSLSLMPFALIVFIPWYIYKEHLYLLSAFVWLESQ